MVIFNKCTVHSASGNSSAALPRRSFQLRFSLENSLKGDLPQDATGSKAAREDAMHDHQPSAEVVEKPTGSTFHHWIGRMAFSTARSSFIGIGNKHRCKEATLSHETREPGTTQREACGPLQPLLWPQTDPDEDARRAVGPLINTKMEWASLIVHKPTALMRSLLARAMTPNAI